MNLITKYLTNNPCYKKGLTIKVKGLMLHSVGVNQPNPLVFVNSWNKSSFSDACVHGFIGIDDVYITLPCMEKSGVAHRGWHGGGSSNDTHIGIEMCEPSQIKYVGGASFTISDKTSAVKFVEQVTKNAVDLFATLCIFHNLNPKTDIISHAEGNKRGIASAHADPDHLWSGLGMNYNMDKFRADVENKIKIMKGEIMDNTPHDWGKDAVNWAVNNKIMTGDDKGNLKLSSPITREEFVVMLKRFYDKFGK